MVRAVGPASTCAEYALPLLKKSGFAIIFRGQWTDEEEDLFMGALDTLGGELVAISSWETPLTHGIRHCLYVKKIEKIKNELYANTDDYGEKWDVLYAGGAVIAKLIL